VHIAGYLLVIFLEFEHLYLVVLAIQFVLYMLGVEEALFPIISIELKEFIPLLYALAYP
jgi:hypothetical protein